MLNLFEETGDVLERNGRGRNTLFDDDQLHMLRQFSIAIPTIPRQTLRIGCSIAPVYKSVLEPLGVIACHWASIRFMHKLNR